MSLQWKFPFEPGVDWTATSPIPLRQTHLDHASERVLIERCLGMTIIADRSIAMPCLCVFGNWSLISHTSDNVFSTGTSLDPDRHMESVNATARWCVRSSLPELPPLFLRFLR